MALLDVTVKIDLTQPIGSVGLGVPLILEAGATNEVAYTECKTIATVKAAGFADTSDVYKAALTMLMQNNAPSTIAVCATSKDADAWLSDIDNLGLGWRQLVVVGDVDVAKVMTAIETTKDKLYFADLDLESATSLTVNGIKRTVLVYAKATTDYPSAAAAVVGATAGKVAGSINYKNTQIKGIVAQTVTDTELEAIHAKGGLTIVKKAGDVVTSAGKTAGGDYIDIIDSTDYVINNIEYRTQKALNNNDKIKFDDTGIAILESVAVSVMRDAYNNGIIATDEDGTPMYSVNYLPRASTTETDRANRHYTGGQFAFTVSGAVDTCDVVGELII